MSVQSEGGLPVRDERHEALSVFLGEWSAIGQSYGGPHQSAADPKSHAFPWESSHIAEWHTGSFFLIQSESTMIGPDGPRPFDTLSIMGIDEKTGRYFARTFDNLGFYRNYAMSVDGRTWRLKGDTERALLEFSEDGATQTIFWEWKPADKWLPLCERTATKQDRA